MNPPCAYSTIDESRVGEVFRSAIDATVAAN
jgi:hypothetical protein